MDEKKLTDEEIVKAYEHCDDYIGCEPCILANKDCRLTVLDLIHRLQSENAGYEKLKLFNLAMANGELDMSISGEYATAFFNAIIEIFDQNGGKNFFTTTLDIEGRKGRYAFTIEKVGGQTVAEKLAEQKAEIELLKSTHLTVECHAPVIKDCECVKQAVKDTAKEILTELVDKAHSNGCIDLTVNEVKAWFREDFGVEVE